MRNLKVIALAATLLSLVLATIWQWHRCRVIGAELAFLREQAPQKAPVDGYDAPASESSLPGGEATNQNQGRELLRLRGEVGSLRRELADARQMQAVATARTTDPRDATISLRALEQYNQEAGFKALFARDWMAAFTEYASHHEGLFPTNFDQAAEFLSEVAKARTNIETGEFEVVYQGSRNEFTNETDWDTIVLRERSIWQRYDGKWGRIYGLAHGAALQRFFDDQSALTEWEAQHIRRNGN